jgi:hypothetical protein
MKKFLLISASFIFLTGCAQNVALLGPTYSIVKTGGIQQALVGQTISYGVKHQTGKNVSTHVADTFDGQAMVQECKLSHSNSLDKVFFNSLQQIDCEIAQ